MGRVVSVNISVKKGTVKQPIESAQLKENHGIEGDAHAGAWHRQISLLASESIDKMIKLGATGLSPGRFAENITTEGIDICSLPIGSRLRLGGALVEVTQIGKECHHHCEVYRQVGMCIMPTEGIFVKVLEEGQVEPGDPVEIVYRPITAAVLVASDKGHRGEREDLSGPELKKLLEGHALVLEIVVLPDERGRIAEYLKKTADSGLVDLILTSGGTGFAPRDVTPEATMDAVERLAPGIPEAMRAKSLEITNRAMLSRAVAGIRGRTLIVNMPGSPRAVRECMEVFLPVLEHAIKTVRGETFECAAERPGNCK
ncbi:MAG: molybdenum cofactor synthesis domain-containing protein [Bacillota bacterium]